MQRSLSRKIGIFAALMLLLVLYLYSRPIFLNPEYTFRGYSYGVELPFREIEPRTGPYQIDLQIYARALFPKLYSIEANECLMSVRVNDHLIERPMLPTCNHPRGTSLHLAPYLRSGLNTISIESYNHGGFVDLNIRPHLLDPFTGWLVIGAITLLFILFHPAGSKKYSRQLGFVICCLVVLNLFIPLLLTHVATPMQRLTHVTLNDVPREAKPFYHESELMNGKIEWNLEWIAPALRHRLYWLTTDDCISDMWVNGQFVPVNWPTCTYPNSTLVDLRPALRTGKNQLVVRTINQTGTASMVLQPAKFDPLILFWWLVVAGIVCLLVHTIVHALRPKKSLLWYLETYLCSGFILARIWHYWWHLRDVRAWDPTAHIEMVNHISWLNPIPSHLFEKFYSYHPPVGFLLPRIPLSLGLSAETSVHLLSAASALVVFFALRSILKHLQLLYSVGGIAFLYVAVSIPLQLFLAASINLDSLMLAYAALSLLLSVKLYSGPQPPMLKAHRSTLGLLILVHWLALMTKFSGVVLLCIPVLTALCFQWRNLWKRGKDAWYMRWKKVFLVAVVASTTAVALAFPYYHFRYHREAGTYFPSNGSYFDKDRQASGREKMEADRWKYVQNLFGMSQPQKRRANFSDLEHNRLQDTWSDFWIRDLYLTNWDEPDNLMSIFYLSLMPILIFFGFILYIRLLITRTKPRWLALGTVFALLSCIQLAALIAYLFQNPCTKCYGTKAVYIAPVIWFFAFLIVQPLLLLNDAKWSKWKLVLFLLPVVLFLFINHFYPVY